MSQQDDWTVPFLLLIYVMCATLLYLNTYTVPREKDGRLCWLVHVGWSRGDSTLACVAITYQGPKE